MPDGGYTLITSSTFGGNNAVNISSIPSTYQHLVLIVRCADASGPTSDLRMRFNGSSIANYNSMAVTFRNTAGFYTLNTAQELRTTFNDVVGTVQNNTLWCDIFNYSASTQKTVLMRYAGINGNAVNWGQGNWNNTPAIDSINLAILTGTRTFASNSEFWLYGIYGVT